MLVGNVIAPITWLGGYSDDAMSEGIRGLVGRNL